MLLDGNLTNGKACLVNLSWLYFGGHQKSINRDTSHINPDWKVYILGGQFEMA